MSVPKKGDLVKLTKIEAYDSALTRNVEEGDWMIGTLDSDCVVGQTLEATRLRNNRYNGLKFGNFWTSVVREIHQHDLGFVLFTDNSKYFVDVLNPDVWTLEFIERMPATAGFMNPFLESLKAALRGVTRQESIPNAARD